MSKLGHLAFRQLLDEFGGCGLMFSEMCGDQSVRQGLRHAQSSFRWRPEEAGRLVCQLFGNDPNTMADAARRVASEGFFGVDLNFGCSVAALCRRGCGAALLRNPPLAVEIVNSVRRAVDLPLFVKFRIGWEDRPGAAVELARRFEDAGADALTFHPRVAPDRRTRPPKWAYIGRVKQAVSIPVFGNGNVFDFSDCTRMLDQTGCDGIALGRLAVAKPWIFSQWAAGRREPEEVHRRTALRLLELLEIHFDAPTALRRFNKFAAYFCVNFRYGHQFYARICRAATLADVRRTLSGFFSRNPETVDRPNISLMR
jgi:tRNA-dihydrouridine synthase B